MLKITPVLLAGGSGTRLWPLSRKSYPKQFSSFDGEKTLFQECALRLNSSNNLDFLSPVVVTNNDFRYIVAEQLRDINIGLGKILIEPVAKNTAPAILAASLYAYENDPNNILLVAPSDHIIPDIKSFHKAIQKTMPEIYNNKMVTFGITPSNPETGYGYIKCGNEIRDEIKKVISFVEKPSTVVAKKMTEDGNYLWNAGIFMFCAKDMISAFQEYAPEILDKVKKSLNNCEKNLDFLFLDTHYWSQITDISIDYAIMEKAKNLISIPFSSGWSDLGDWHAIWKKSKKDNKGVVLSKNAHFINCTNTLLRTEAKNQQLVGVGLNNVIAIAMHDAVLVADLKNTQDIKKVVSHLRKLNIKQADIFPKSFYPWGYFDNLVDEDNFQVNRISVNPGEIFYFENCSQKSKHWVILEGVGKIIIKEKEKILTKGQYIDLSISKIQKIGNIGKLPLELIEIQQVAI